MITADACLGHYPEFHYVSTLSDSSEPLTSVRKLSADIQPARGGAADGNIGAHALGTAATHAADGSTASAYHGTVPRDDTIRGAQVGSLANRQAAGALTGGSTGTGRALRLPLSSDDNTSERQKKKPKQAESGEDAGLTVDTRWRERQQQNSPEQVGDEKVGPIEPEKSEEEEPWELDEEDGARRWHATSEQTLRQLDDEENGLREQRRKMQRDADTVTEDMREEVMELLRLFGLPYIVAPMEAEAQCAVLEQLGLVHGVVTDDSDAFVFGAKTVYKNIFDDKKYVEAYLASDVESEFGLGQGELIALAMLLGSDYTEGIKGVGIVNAMEILRAFPANNAALDSASVVSGLANFKAWMDVFDPVGQAQKKPPKADLQAMSEVERFDAKHRNAKLKWVAGTSFPDPHVAHAYIKPEANKSTEAFTWAPPDLDGVRRYCAEMMGWPKETTDQTMRPLMAQLQQADNQARLDSYYTTYHDNARFAKVQSARLRKAISGTAGPVAGQAAEEDAASKTQARDKKRRRKKDPDAPKGVRSAYILFCQHSRKDIKAAATPGTKATEITALLGARWKDMDATEKEKWNAEAANDRERYERELAVYEVASTPINKDSKLVKRRRTEARKRPEISTLHEAAEVMGGDSQSGEEDSEGDSGAAVTSHRRSQRACARGKVEYIESSCTSEDDEGDDSAAGNEGVAA